MASIKLPTVARETFPTAQRSFNCRVDRQTAGPGGDRWQGGRQLVDLSHPLSGSHESRSLPTGRRRLVCHAAQHGSRARQALRTFTARSCNTPSPGDRERVLLRLLSSPKVSPFPPTTCRRSKPRCEDRAADFKFSREEVAPAKAKICFTPKASGSRTRSSTSWSAKANLRQHLSPRRFHRPLHWAARAEHRAVEGVQTAEHGGGLLAGHSTASNSPAFTARLLRQEDLEAHLIRLRNEEARSPRDRCALGLLPSTTPSAKAHPLEAQRRNHCQELQNFISEHLRGRDTARSLRRTSAGWICTRHPVTFRITGSRNIRPIMERKFIAQKAADGCSCAQLANLMETGEIDGYMLKPMNCPHHIKIFASEQRSYARCRSAGRVWHGLPLGKTRRAERHDPRPRFHPGRPAPVLHRDQVAAEVQAAWNWSKSCSHPRHERIPRSRRPARSGQRQVCRQR